MKRVLHLIESAGLYGAESVILNLSSEMLEDGEFEPTVGCIVREEGEPSDLYDEARSRGIPAVKLRMRNGLLPFDLPGAARRVRKLGIDLIHSHGYKPSVYGSAVKRLAGCEIMSTCHLWFKGDRTPLKMRAMIALELALYRSFPAIVAVSEPIRAILLEAGIPENIVAVIENGVKVDDDGVSDDAGSARIERELQLRPGSFRILNVGRLSAQKAQADIVRAMKGIPEDLDCEALIVGDGPLRSELQRMIDSLELGNRVRLLGFRKEVPELMGLADVFVLPSIDEGMPMSLLEAAARGVPIIATPVGDVRKLVRDGASGLLVPVNDPQALAGAIVKLAVAPERGREMGKAAREQVRRIYSDRAMYERYRPIYADLVGAK